MDRIKKYKKIVKETIQKHVHLPSPTFPNLQDIFVVDAEGKHFMMLTIGWYKDQYRHSTIYHVEVKDNGKIWVHELRTDVEFDKELIEKGIPEEDIIGGMIEPYTLTEPEKSQMVNG